MAKTEKIKILMWRVRISGAEIARRVNCSQQLVSLVILSKRKNQRVEDAIAEAVGVPVGELFSHRGSEAA